MIRYGVLFVITCLLLSGIFFLRVPETFTEPEPPVEPFGLNHLIPDSLSDIEEAKRMEKDIADFMRRWEITGASVAVMKDGKLLYSKGFGLADTAAGEKMETRHIMRIASLSKLITAVAVMKLYEDGKLSLDDKVFGPEGILSDTAFTARIKDSNITQITVEHLLRHQGGFTIRAGDPLFDSRLVARQTGCTLPLGMDDLISFAASTRLRYRPGGSNIYSNLGYVVLGKVIEKASGMDYETYVKTHILGPVGCNDMHLGYSDPALKYPNETAYYEPSDAEQVECYDGGENMVSRRYGGCNLHLLGAAGGWVASPTELLKFITAIDYSDDKADILSRHTIDLMTSDNKDEFPIGWMRTNSSGDWSRTGSLAGSSALIKRQKDGYTWVLLTNASSWSGSRFTGKIGVMMTQAISRVKSWPERDLFEKADMGTALGQTTAHFRIGDVNIWFISLLSPIFI